MCSKKLFTFCLVLALASLQVFAWPVKAEKIPVEAPTPTVEETSQNPSLPTQNDNSTKLEQMSTNLDNKMVVMGSDLTALKEDMADLTVAFATLVADNRALNDELAKERGSKWFADLGASFGFKNDDLVYGVVGDIGYRLKSSLMLKLGTQMTIGTLTDVKKIVDLNINKERFVFTATVGWEW